ncbi:neuroligin-like protein glit-1 [Stegodyphus dumicola]|uniref:neuroligin-like protein glit-1 n=1 Tax=Stegodyphus dumicola TaxID=202533 RepID=UPI0015AE1AF0|nr:neuroligin-like protein glit-1 [Stegodyphus dumicola]
MIKHHKDNLHADFSYMSGVTRDEAVSMLLNEVKLKGSKFNYEITKSAFQQKIQEYSAIFNYTLDVVALSKAIEFMYLPHEKDLGNQTLLRKGYINMLSDSYVKAPNDKMLKLLLKRKIRTYTYVLNSSLEGLQSIKDHEHNIFGDVVPHDTEYYFITGAPFMDPKLYPDGLNLQEAQWTERDRNMSQFFMTVWANFAKFGNPTPAKVFDISWELTDSRNMQYLSINTTNFTTVMLSGYRQKESQFWNSYLPALMKLNSTPASYCQPLFQPWEDKKHHYLGALWGVLGAVGLFLILSVLCFYLYCRAKNKHVVSTEDIPDAVSMTPSSIDTLLNMKRVDPGNRYYPETTLSKQKHTQV